MKRVVELVIAVLLCVGVGYAIYRNMSPSGEAPPSTEVASTTTSTGSAPSTSATTPAQTAPAFVFRRLQVNTTEDLPEACLVFSESLDDSGKVRYEDYVRFEEDVQAAFKVRDEQLCISGLDFASSYHVELRKGMPSAKGDALAYDENIPVELTDRPARVQFGDGMILPRDSAEGVTVTTVNVDALKIRVFRVGDRLLSQLESWLLDQRAFYSYETDQVANDQGELVWQGEMGIKSERNGTAQTLFRVRDVVKDWRPGVYLVVAEDAATDDQIRQSGVYYDNAMAAQWIIDSDIGLTTFSGNDGLHVFARSLSSADTMSGVRLTLVARNNEILGEARTASDGSAVFEASLLRGPGGAEPVAVMAYGSDEDFNYADLRRPAFDLSDRGVSGRSVPGEIDAFLYTERGIYRPGETVHLVAMLRDRMVEALGDVPLTISVLKPNGNEYRRLSTSEQKAGASDLTIPLSGTAPRGRWEAVAYVDTGGEPVGRVSFDVQDFVPERLGVEVKSGEAYWQPLQDFSVEVDSRFLYGAPAAGLAGEGELKIMIDPDPYPDFPGYRFGRVEDSFDGTVDYFDVPITDAQGHSVLTGTIPEVAATTLPLMAQLRVSVFEPGGRATRNEISKPLRTHDVMIGIHANFEGDVVAENSAAGFEIIALDRDGQRIARPGLAYRLIREDYDYQWYQQDGRWYYDAVVRDHEVASGALDVALDAPTKYSEVVSWGQYRLVVTDKNSDAASSMRFYVGWGGVADASRPDRVAVTADKAAYVPGEDATLDIRSLVSGKALVVIANDRVHEQRLIDVSKDGTRLSVPVSDEWGSGAYALVTVYRPLGNDLSNRAPVRSIGLVWLGVDRTARKLSVDIATPERVVPRQTVSIPLEVKGLERGESAFVTVAAVDQGILQLTRFETPSPADFYFGKRRLEVDIRDDYGRLILDTGGQPGEIRVGGDDLGGTGLSVVPTKTVALFSGLVAVDASGKASVEFAIPDFVGELKIMAIAMSGDKVGKGERALTVRDDVVADITLPRFLAPGDESQATVLVHNVDGAPGDYRAQVSLGGAIRTTSGGESFEQTVTLADDERKEFRLPVTGMEPGIGTVTVALSGPNNYAVTRNWPIEVRAAQLSESNELVAVMAPGETVTLNRDLVADFYPDTASVAMTVSSTRGIDVPGLLRWLDRYPYGCLEQTVSRAFPLLYFNDMALVSNERTDATIKGRVQDAVERVVDMQTPVGSFGMWGPYDADAYEWLSVFAIDFLLQAKEQDYIVPTDAIMRGTSWLRSLAGQTFQDRWTRSYAYYVLAREGALNPGDLRYFADEEIKERENPMSAAHLGAALTQIGDRSRARLAFARAVDESVGASAALYSPPPYGSRLRDLSGVLALAAPAGYNDLLPPLFDALAGVESRLEYTTTQEKAWLLFAAYELSRAGGQLRVDVKGTQARNAADPVYVTPTAAELNSGVSVVNTGDKDVWRSLTVAGVPKASRPAAANGFSMARVFLDLDGQEVDLASVRQNQQVVVLISGQMPDDTYRQMVALDMLPAGWEIEAVIRSDDRTYGFLPQLIDTRLAEARDDRFVAAFDVGDRFERPLQPNEAPRRPVFALAYVVRAVTPGAYVLPAARVEDLYGPQVFARTNAGKLTVLPMTP